MAYKSRRERKRAAGGSACEGSPHKGGVALIIGVGPKKKRDGGKVSGEAAKHHLGRRARGGATKRAEGGSTQDADARKLQNDYRSYDPDQQKMMTDYSTGPVPGEKRRGGEIERTPSGGVKASARHKAEAHGETMKGGSFPIRNAADLANAKHDVGRAKNPEAARRWINQRARELGEPPIGR